MRRWELITPHKLEITAQQDDVLRKKAELAGLDISQYAVRLLEEGSLPGPGDGCVRPYGHTWFRS